MSPPTPGDDYPPDNTRPSRAAEHQAGLLGGGVAGAPPGEILGGRRGSAVRATPDA